MVAQIPTHTPQASQSVHTHFPERETAAQKPKRSYIFDIVALGELIQVLHFTLKTRNKNQDKKLEGKYDALTKESSEKMLYSGNRSWQVTAALSGAQLTGSIAPFAQPVTQRMLQFIVDGGKAASLANGIGALATGIGQLGTVAGPNSQMLAQFFTAEPSARTAEINSVLQQLNTQMQSSSANQDTALKDMSLQVMREAFEALSRAGR